MSLQTAILAAALSLPQAWYPPGKEPETEAEHRARVETIAEAIATEADDRATAFAVLSVMYHESGGFRLSVHAGKKRGDRGRAICLAQHHRNGRGIDEWESLAGTDLESTRRCARATVEALQSADRWCRARGRATGWAATFALYGSGKSCLASVGQSRERTMRRLLARF